MKRKIEWLVTITDRGRGRAVADVCQRHQIAVQWIVRGHGTASSQVMDMLGLDEPEKDIVLSLVPGALCADVFRALEHELHVTRPGAGIAFSVALSGISSITHHRVTHGRAELCLPQEGQTMLQQNQHELIVAVTDADGVDIVMTAARRAGAKGGTVAKSREVCSETVQKLFGLTLQPEKELVMILVPARIRQDVMQAICGAMSCNLSHRGPVFSLPVNTVLGLHGTV